MWSTRWYTIDIKGLGWVDSWLEGLPVDKIIGDGVCPHNVSPYCTVGVILVEEVIDAFVVHWSCHLFLSTYTLTKNSKKKIKIDQSKELKTHHLGLLEVWGHGI